MRIIMHDGTVKDWKIDDGAPNEDQIRFIEYIVLETEEEYYEIHRRFYIPLKCKNLHPELISYYGETAKFILGNL